MKLVKLLQLSAIIFVFSNLLSGQTALNLENGFKPYGSYDSSNFDSVDLETGNLILHAPIIPDYPQRGGKLTSELRLYVSSHNWMMSCKPNFQGLPSSCAWKGGGSGVGIEYVGWLSVQRTITITVDPNFGSQFSVGGGYSLSTWDGATHQLYDTSGGTLSSFVTMDSTGYQVAVSNPDQNGIPQTVVVTDRQGTQHVGTFGPSRCSDPVPAAPRPAGGYARVYDQWMISPSLCVEHSLWQYDVDTNGNVLSLAPPLVSSTPPLDTMGRPTWGLQASVASDSAGCAGSVPYANSYTTQYVAFGGAQNLLKVCYGTLPIQTSFGINGIAEYQVVVPGASANVLTTVILPNGTKWVFNYDSYGNVTSISLPTGGSITYSWVTLRPDIATLCALNNPWHPTPAIRVIKQRILTDNNGHTSTWTYNWGAVQADNSVTNWVTGPSGNDTIHAFKMFPASPCTTASTFHETTTQFWQGAKDSGTLLKQIDTSYGRSISMGNADSYAYEANPVPTDIKTIVYPANKVSLVHRDFDSAFGASGPTLGNVISEKVYDWGLGSPGSLLREKDTVYKWQKDSAYLSANLIDLPASTVVISPTAASNTKSSCPVNPTTNAACMAETDYFYDETAPQAHLGTPPAGTLVTPSSTVRGNLTTTSEWLSTSNNFISSTSVWFDTGMLAQTTDPLGHITTYSYDPSETYVVKTCNPKNQCVYGSYDFNTGSQMTFTDVNGSAAGDAAHTTNYNYETLTARLASALAPPDPGNNNARAQTSFNYSDVTSPNVFPLTVTRTRPITAALTDSSTTTFDGLGRSYKTEHAMPSGSPATAVTTYDAAHDLVTVTNPYFSLTDVTYGSTTSLSDAIGRVTQITEQDGSTRSTHYDVVTGVNALAPGTTTLGNCTDLIDEAGHQRRSCADGLGRLVEVDEPNPGATAIAATGYVAISGSEQSATSQAATAASITVNIGGSDSTNTSTVCTPSCHTINSKDSGQISFSVNVGGTNIGVSAPYNGNSTLATLAAALYSNFPANSQVSMSNPNGGTSFTLTANPGSLGNGYILTTGVWTSCLNSDTMSCGGPGWTMTLSGPGLAQTTASTANLTGGQNASTSPDTGTVTVTLNGTAYQTSYGGTDDAGSIATRLAALISAGSLANASATGGTINLTSKTAGAQGNYSLAASYTYNSSVFVHASFTTATPGSRLAGGYAANDLDNGPYQTLYSYDALGNLLRVDQKGSASSDSTQWRTRTFTYDSLSRLLTANNPESGTITYSYDADGNLLQKTSPAPNQTGTATQTVSYCYDELHRLLAKGYTASPNPPQQCLTSSPWLPNPATVYAYDSGTNAKGHLTSLTDQAGTASYTYDILGRLASETRPILGVSKTTSYTYNLNGSVKTLTYPSGRVLTYTPDSAGRPASVVDGNGTQYVSSATYYPNGAEYQRFMPSIYFRTDFNARLQVSGFYSNNGTDTGVFVNKTYDYGTGHNNGNVISITNNKDSNRTQTFTYDALNRIASGYSSANTGNYSWGENYSIDAWGNLQISPMGGKAHGGTFQLSGNAQNRPTGLAYDAAGNLMSYLSSTYTYDQENRLSSTAGMSYTYDANGERVLKTNTSTGATVKRYWSMGGNTLAEGDGSGNLTAEYIYFGGKRVARIDLPANTVHYYLSDHLGSTSIVANAAGTVEEESDYHPFGTEINVTGPGANELKFTGKRRDTESQLDYFGARYYSNAFGRFLTPDWAAKAAAVPYAEFADPQSLNLYTYVRNIPTTKMDVDGHCDASKGWCQVLNFIGCFCQPVQPAPLPPSTANTLSQAADKVAPLVAKLAPVAVAVGLMTKADQLKANQQQGKDFEQSTKANLQTKQTGVQEQITIKTDSGVKTRVDFASTDQSGQTALTEAKSSETAPLTPNQTKAFPEIQQTGGTVVGQGKPGFPGGTRIPPTEIEIVRPPIIFPE